MAVKKPSFGTPQTPRENWSLRYIELQDAYDKRIHAALREALDSADAAMAELEGKSGIGARVQRAQLAGTRSALLQAIGQLYAAIGKIIKAGSEDAAEASTRAFLHDEEELLEILFTDQLEREVFRDAAIAKARRNIQAVMKRILVTEQPLSKRLYKSQALAKGNVNRVLNNHLARGSSAAEMAKDLHQYISPNSPGGISYVAKRLARTEMNNAFHAQSIQDIQDAPWCDECEWHLSKSHPANQPEDACDYYAYKKTFPANEVPKKPHPNCLCYTVPKLMDEETFISNLLAGNFNSWLEKQG